MRIAILGAGAMGGLYGGSLALIGHEIVFLDVSQATIDAINQNGLKLTTNGGANVIRAKACTAREAEGPFDLMILFTKTIHSEGALESAKHLFSDETLVLSLQNGLGNQEVIEKFLPPSQILIGMTGYPADAKGPGVVESHGSSFTAFMNADGVLTEKAEHIAEEITKAGLNCTATPDVYVFIWEKVSFNAAVNALTSITRLPCGVMAEKGGRELAFAVAQEGVDTANALGYKVDGAKVREMLEHAFVDHYSHKPSMLQDVLAGRQTEVAFISGAIAAAAKKAGRSAPINETLYTLVSILQNSYDIRL